MKKVCFLIYLLKQFLIKVRIIIKPSLKIMLQPQPSKRYPVLLQPVYFYREQEVLPSLKSEMKRRARELPMFSRMRKEGHS